MLTAPELDYVRKLNELEQASADQLFSLFHKARTYLPYDDLSYLRDHITLELDRRLKVGEKSSNQLVRKEEVTFSCALPDTKYDSTTMSVEQLCVIWEEVTKKTLPSDVVVALTNVTWESRNSEDKKLGDLDVIHLLRFFVHTLENNKAIRNQWKEFKNVFERYL